MKPSSPLPMKNQLIALSGLLLLAHHAAGGPEESKGIVIPQSRASSGWEFGINANAIIGVEAEFSDLGHFNSPNAIPPATGNADREYDDGFNRIDATGNAGDLTSYWGYQNSSQYNPAGAGSISLSISNSLHTGSARDEDTGFGGEIFAYKRLGGSPFPQLPDASWGIRLGTHVNSFSFDNHSAVDTSYTRTTDQYDLGGLQPPGAPFSGSPLGFGNVLLGDIPSRSEATISGAGVSGSRSLDATIVGFSFGPYLDLPLNDKFSARLEAGGALAVAFGDYDYSETTTIPGLPSQSSSGHDSETSLLPGFFVGIKGIYRIDSHWSVDTGIRYQWYDSFEVKADHTTAEMDFGSSFMVHLGVSYRF